MEILKQKMNFLKHIITVRSYIFKNLLMAHYVGIGLIQYFSVLRQEIKFLKIRQY